MLGLVGSGVVLNGCYCECLVSTSYFFISCLVIYSSCEAQLLASQAYEALTERVAWELAGDRRQSAAQAHVMHARACLTTRPGCSMSLLPADINFSYSPSLLSCQSPSSLIMTTFCGQNCVLLVEALVDPIIMVSSLARCQGI